MNRYKLQYCLLFALAFAFAATAQTTAKRSAKPQITTKNSIAAYANFGKTNSLSLNYQRKIAGTKYRYFSAGVGISQLQTTMQVTELSAKARLTDFSLPHNILYNFGTSNGHFGEIGIGGNYNTVFNVFKNASYNVYPMLGYRYQPTNSKLFVHLYIAPMLNEQREVKGNTCLSCPILDRNAIAPTGGIGAGWNF
jgi:hypothetical protein